MKLYDVVKRLLEIYPALRNSDKKLLWAVWNVKGLVVNPSNQLQSGYGYITRGNFYKAPSSESVTRARRKVQELHPELRAVKEVEEQRNLNAIKTQAWALQGKQQEWWK